MHLIRELTVANINW